MATKSILLVDDHQLFRTGLQLLLSNTPKYMIAGEAATGNEMLDFLSTNPTPDIVLLDIAMPQMDGITAAKIALEKYPALKIITLSMYGEEDYYFTLLSLGVKGFLLKNSNITEVRDAIEQVLSGGTYFSPELLNSLIDSADSDAILPEDSFSTLSEREKEIITLICRGLTTNEIADILSISRRTVDKHRENIMEKTTAKNTANLVVYAIKHKLIRI